MSRMGGVACPPVQADTIFMFYPHQAGASTGNMSPVPNTLCVFFELLCDIFFHLNKRTIKALTRTGYTRGETAVPKPG